MSNPQSEHTSGQRSAGLLCNRADRRSLIFPLLTLGLLMLPFFAQPEGLAIPGLILLSTLFCFNACIVNHNHIHHPTLRSPLLNEGFGHLLGLAKGHTSHGVLVAHNLNHHRYHGGEHDWIRPGLAGEGPGIVRLARYVISASVSMALGRNSADAPVMPGRLQRQLQRERVSLWLFMGLVLWLDWQVALLFVFLPWGLGMLLLTGVNLLQHDGCQPGDPYRNSRNFTGRLGNWFFLNNGFHTAHHLEPGMHWSLLRRFHEQQLAGRVPGQLNEPSILSFLLRRYLLAAGAPVRST